MSDDFKKYLNFYKFDCILPGSGRKIEFKPIMTGDLKKLLVYEDETNPEVIETALDDLIESCVIDDDFSVDDLYLQDRFFLLFEIRKRTKGETYKFQVNCPSCKSQNVNIIDLNSLKVNHISPDLNEYIKLDDNLTLRMSHIIRGAQKEVFSSLSSLDFTRESEYLANLAILTVSTGIIEIITPDGKEDNITLDDKKFFVENITTGMYEKISQWYVENNFGIDFTFNMRCTNCDYNKKHSIPMNNFFL